MRIENTLDSKAKFFAQYWGQELIRNSLFDFNSPIAVCQSSFNSEALPHLSLELTPLSQITGEDAIDVFNLLFSHSETHRNKPDDFKASFGDDWTNSIFFDSYGQYYPKDYIQMIDFLRSKGYALPFMGISIETLIEWGWIKLKES